MNNDRMLLLLFLVLLLFSTWTFQHLSNLIHCIIHGLLLITKTAEAIDVHDECVIEGGAAIEELAVHVVLRVDAEGLGPVDVVSVVGAVGEGIQEEHSGSRKIHDKVSKGVTTEDVITRRGCSGLLLIIVILNCCRWSCRFMLRR